MYWIDDGKDMIQRANFDGTKIENLISSLYNPVFLVVDMDATNLYWTDMKRKTIQHAHLFSKLQEKQLEEKIKSINKHNKSFIVNHDKTDNANKKKVGKSNRKNQSKASIKNTNHK